jgi:sulfoacetaldehyde dehydrogenase
VTAIASCTDDARNDLSFTLSLSCATRDGNLITENVNAGHVVDLTWLTWTISPKVIAEEELFAVHWFRYGRG